MKNQNTTRKSMLRKECESATQSLKREFGLSHILGRSKAVQKLCQKINKISLCKVNVLISGETGTGKELAARAIHYLSRRAGKPFIPVNCGAIPESLFENELFGHVKGAFTDAGLQQTGLVREAECGTLFLDEIGVISPYIQAKLLRLVQDKEYRPVGDSRRHKADVRIIAATNTDLQSLVEQDTFRKDLFYRLNVVSIYMPPLKERVEDIPILVEHFINRYSREYDKSIEGLSRDAMKAFMSYSWPGNIRELENKIQQIIVMSTTPVIEVEAIQLPISESNSKGSELEHFNIAKKKVIDSFAKTYLARLLTEQCGDVVSGARRAGKSRTGFWNLLKKYNISPEKFR
jgi:transcriptional regulator with PAS, ATPase and Fis domain